MTLYEKIEMLSIKKGISISNLGEAVGIKLDKSTISHWKKGAKPRPDKVKAIADYFNVSIEYLLNEEEIKEEPQKQNPSLTDEQRELVEAFKKASPEEKALVMAYLRAKDGK